MKSTQLAPHGGPADVCWHRGRIVACWQSGAGANVRLVIVEIEPISHAVLVHTSLALGDDVGAFPRLLSAHGSLWCIYREGVSLGGRAVLLRDGREVWRSPGECGGNDPMCLGFANGEGVAAWQRAGDNRVSVFYIPTMVGQAPWAGRPTGLSHFTERGDLVLVDDARGAIAGMTRPCADGAIVAGEHPDSGVLVRDLRNSHELRIWPGEETVTPRLAAAAPTGTHAVVTSGVRAGVDYGVRLATFSVDELVAPVPVPAIDPWPPGRGWTRRDDIDEIDIVDYLLGSQNWSRNGMHVAGDAVTYTHPFQSRVTDEGDTQGAVQHTKFGPPDTRAATWTFTDEWVGLAFDGTNELRAGYRFVNPGTIETAAIYPRLMQVGEQHRRVVELDILDLATGGRRRVTWAGWVEAVYDGPQIGDLPPSRHAVIMFEPAFGDSRGWRERNICIQGIGCWYWDRHRKTPGAVPDMRWIGTRNAPRFPDIPAQFATAIPVARDTDQPNPNPTPIPQPGPDPMKPRDQFFAEFERVNQFYASPDGLKRPGGMVIGVPVDGVEVPTADVVAMRQWGYDLMAGATADQIIASIRQSEEWKTKHPPAEPSFPPDL